MAENVAHLVVVSSATSLAGAYTEIGGLNSASLTRDREVLDITSFKDTSAHKIKLMGLKDTKLSLGGNRDLADAGQTSLDTRYGDGASTFIEIKWDGVAGTSKKGEFKVTSFAENADVAGIVEFSAELEGTPNAGASGVWG